MCAFVRVYVCVCVWVVVVGGWESRKSKAPPSPRPKLSTTPSNSRKVTKPFGFKVSHFCRNLNLQSLFLNDATCPTRNCRARSIFRKVWDRSPKLGSSAADMLLNIFVVALYCNLDI